MKVARAMIRDSGIPPFGNGVVVIPGQESNTANPANWHNWFLETGVQGGFYYPDVVFDSTYWSAADH